MFLFDTLDSSMNEPIWHHIPQKEILNILYTCEQGLSSSQVQDQRNQHGKNEFPKEHIDGWVSVFFRQFKSPMILILIMAGIVSFILQEWVDVWVIFAAVMLNTLIGFIQEYKANKALEQIQKLVQPRSLVLRDGRDIEILAEDVVPGDVLILSTGDRVTADARLLEAIELMTNEAALTGESFPVHKDVQPREVRTSLAERSNMVYTGTSIIGGRGRAVVVATGMRTELGTIAGLVEQTAQTQTPLQDQLKVLARWLAGLVLTLVTLLFIIGLISGRAISEMFEMSVAVAVAAIPEGLIVCVTIILAIGMQRILRRRSLVRRLVAAETLGSVSIICSDKTGTLTQAQMRVTHVLTPGHIQAFPFFKEQTLDVFTQKMFDVMALCNDATVIPTQEKERFNGSPTERALMMAVVDLGIDVNSLLQTYPRIAEIPFNSSSKFMVTSHVFAQHTEFLLKGASGPVMDLCTQVYIDGKMVELDSKQREQLEIQEEELTQQGIRLLALAFKIPSVSNATLSRESLGGFTFLGFVGLRDPLRAQAREQIASAARAGVRTVLITGDHPQTARAIAQEAGLISDSESNVVVGSELDAWSDEELFQKVPLIFVYARVEPRHKIRIVKAWQAHGEVVAMVGDGVNDAPALKTADIGVALGSGTEVAKQASDLILLNNDLGTITAAIEEGRVIFDNIRKTSVYLLADSFTELILIGGSLLLGLPLPLLPVQILWINLIADSFPTIGLTLEPPEEDVMRIGPRPRGEPVLNREMLTLIFVIGVVTDLVLFVLYFWLLGSIDNVTEVRSIMFAAVGIDSLFYVFAVKRLRTSIFRTNPFSNRWLLLGEGIALSLMLLALLHPFFQAIFEVTPLSLYEWILLLMMGMIKLLAIEGVKEIFLRKKALSSLSSMT